MDKKDPLHNYVTELRRGSLTLAVLGCLSEARYGYALLQVLQEQGIAIEANTLYPMLRRLESQGLLASDWDTTESRPRKYYKISKLGQLVFKELLAEWEKMQESIAVICGREKDESKSD